MPPVDKEGRQVHVRKVGEDGGRWGKWGKGKGGGRGREKGTVGGRGEGGTCHNDKPGLIGCGRKVARGEERGSRARPAAMASRALVERGDDEGGRRAQPQ